MAENINYRLAVIKKVIVLDYDSNDKTKKKLAEKKKQSLSNIVIV